LRKNLNKLKPFFKDRGDLIERKIGVFVIAMVVIASSFPLALAMGAPDISMSTRLICGENMQKNGNVYETWEEEHIEIEVCARWVEDPGRPICLWVDHNTLPEGAEVTPDPATGVGQVCCLLSWTPAVGQAGTYNITFYAGEECGVPITRFNITIIVHPAKAKPFFVTPTDGDVIYGETVVWIGESVGTEIQSVEFQYSADGGNWIPICEDNDGSERTVGGKEVPLSDWGDGWSCRWDVSNMEEGWYHLLARVWQTEEIHEDVEIMVYVEPTPTIPFIESPEYDEVICENVTISVSTLDEDVVYVVYQYLPAVDYYEKGVEKKDQLKHCWNVNGQNLSTACCGPTAAASCLKYWADHGYPNIMKDPSTGNPITQDELVKKLAELMKTDKDGTKDSNFIEGIRKYLDSVGYGCNNPNGLKVTVEINGYGDPPMDEEKGNECTFKRYKNELEANKEDVLWGIVWNWDDKKKEWKNGHWVVGNSVSNKPLPDSDGDGLTEHEVDVMDPWGGRILKVRMNTDGTYIDPDVGWVYPDIMVSVSEKKPKSLGWITIANVTDPSNGWAAVWNTREVENGIYFLKAIMVDDDGHRGEDIIVVHVQNEMVPCCPEIEIVKGFQFGKVTARVINEECEDLIDLNWAITIDGFVLTGKETAGIINSLASGEETTISSDFVFGFGPIRITVTIDDCEPITGSGFVLGPFIFVQ